MCLVRRHYTLSEKWTPSWVKGNMHRMVCSIQPRVPFTGMPNFLLRQSTVASSSRRVEPLMIPVLSPLMSSSSNHPTEANTTRFPSGEVFQNFVGNNAAFFEESKQLLGHHNLQGIVGVQPVFFTLPAYQLMIDSMPQPDYDLYVLWCSGSPGLRFCKISGAIIAKYHK